MRDLQGCGLGLTLPVHRRQNANAALVYEFMYRFINLGRSYFGKLDEESVKNNFVCVRPLQNGPSLRMSIQLTTTTP